MNQHEFDMLLQKYLEGNCTEEENRLVESWAALMLGKERPVLDDRERGLTGKRIWRQLKRVYRPAGVWSGKLIRIGAGIAASLLLVGIWAVLRPDTRPAPWTGRLDKITGRHRPVRELTGRPGNQEFVLEDGSVVVLDNGSVLQYPAAFGREFREVTLRGGALFKVKKDSLRPFMVYSGNLVTQVLGTSFRISPSEDKKQIEVEVLSGRVSVYENRTKGPGTRNGTIIRANQKITFDNLSRQMTTDVVEEPLLINPPEMAEDFQFEETRLADVVAKIQKAYNVEIVIETPIIENCEFTGDLNELALHTQLKLLCRSINGSYEVRGTTFFLRGEGCHPSP